MTWMWNLSLIFLKTRNLQHHHSPPCLCCLSAAPPPALASQHHEMNWLEQKMRTAQVLALLLQLFLAVLLSSVMVCCRPSGPVTVGPAFRGWLRMSGSLRWRRLRRSPDHVVKREVPTIVFFFCVPTNRSTHHGPSSQSHQVFICLAVSSSHGAGPTRFSTVRHVVFPATLSSWTAGSCDSGAAPLDGERSPPSPKLRRRLVIPLVRSSFVRSSARIPPATQSDRYPRCVQRPCPYWSI